jgi:hypothetical protein
MIKKKRDQVGMLIAEVETVAKRLRVSVRKQAAALPKDLKKMAGHLRQRAAKAAEVVERYAHEARIELEGARPKPRKRVRKASA